MTSRQSGFGDKNNCGYAKHISSLPFVVEYSEIFRGWSTRTPAIH